MTKDAVVLEVLFRTTKDDIVFYYKVYYQFFIFHEKGYVVFNKSRVSFIRLEKFNTSYYLFGVEKRYRRMIPFF